MNPPFSVRNFFFLSADGSWIFLPPVYQVRHIAGELEQIRNKTATAFENHDFIQRFHLTKIG